MNPIKGSFRNNTLTSALCGVMAIIIWAFSPALIKINGTKVGMSEFLFARYFICFFLFSPIINTLWKKRHGITLKNWAIFFISITIHIFLQLYCLRFIPVSWYVVIFSSCPFFTLIMLRVNLSYGMCFCIMLAILGTIVFINPTKLVYFPPMYAVSAAIGTSIAWAVFTVKIVAFQAVYTHFEISGLSTLFSFISSIFFILVAGLNFSAFSSSMLISTTILAICMPLAFVLFSICLRRLPIFAVTSQYLELVLGVGIGVIFFQEKFTLFQLIGSLMVLSAILLASKIECTEPYILQV
ncbi:MAG: DMT family transporter [Candidatus Rickettsiella isopodorum]